MKFDPRTVLLFVVLGYFVASLFVIVGAHQCPGDPGAALCELVSWFFG